MADRHSNEKSLTRAREKGTHRRSPVTVYLIRAGNGLVKIGKAADPLLRLEQLRPLSPVPLSLEHFLTMARAGWLETFLHARFFSRWSHGEWFALGDDDLAWVKSLSKEDVFRLYHDAACADRVPASCAPGSSVTTFHGRLRHLRTAAGLTVAQLAEAAGLHRTHLYQLESGTRGPTWDTVCALASALSVPMDAFRAPK